MTKYEELKEAVLRMEKEEEEYGCGYYNHGPWLKAKDEVRVLVGLSRDYEDLKA